MLLKSGTRPRQLRSRISLVLIAAEANHLTGMNGEKIRKVIAKSLREQGFRIRQDRVFPPERLDKDKVRELHAPAVRHRIGLSKKNLIREEPGLLQRFAPGWTVVPELIHPRLVEVRPDTDEELLFRYASLHWSIPVSSGYGRRIRFLVIDEQNDKLIGLFGLGDPVFNLAARDTWVGWSAEIRRRNLRHVMDAFVLGAVPPYSYLLCGKLVAMLVVSREVRRAFRRKYAQTRAWIRRRKFDGRLALITTTSALGRSSIYNRLKYKDTPLYRSVGFTQGSGEFHFSNGLYSTISAYALRYCNPTAKQQRWGMGFRNRREVIRKVLAKVRLSSEWIYHGIRREVFAIPLAKNTQQFLRGEHSRLLWFDFYAEELFAEFRERWLLPRADRDRRYLDFDPRCYRLWNGKG